TLTRTCPRVGSGMLRSTSSKFPPGLLIWTAFMRGMGFPQEFGDGIRAGLKTTQVKMTENGETTQGSGEDCCRCPRPSISEAAIFRQQPTTETLSLVMRIISH